MCRLASSEGPHSLWQQRHAATPQAVGPAHGQQLSNNVGFLFHVLRMSSTHYFYCEMFHVFMAFLLLYETKLTICLACMMLNVSFYSLCAV